MLLASSYEEPKLAPDAAGHLPLNVGASPVMATRRYILWIIEIMCAGSLIQSNNATAY